MMGFRSFGSWLLFPPSPCYHCFIRWVLILSRASSRIDLVQVLFFVPHSDVNKWPSKKRKEPLANYGLWKGLFLRASPNTKHSVFLNNKNILVLKYKKIAMDENPKKRFHLGHLKSMFLLASSPNNWILAELQGNPIVFGLTMHTILFEVCFCIWTHSKASINFDMHFSQR